MAGLDDLERVEVASAERSSPPLACRTCPATRHSRRICGGLRVQGVGHLAAERGRKLPDSGVALNHAIAGEPEPPQARFRDFPGPGARRSIRVNPQQRGRAKRAHAARTEAGTTPSHPSEANSATRPCGDRPPAPAISRPGRPSRAPRTRARCASPIGSEGRTAGDSDPVPRPGSSRSLRPRAACARSSPRTDFRIRGCS